MERQMLKDVMMNNPAELWAKVNRIIPFAGLCGFMLGLLFGGLNQDNIGWAVARAVFLSLVFAYATKRILVHVMRAWMENKLKEVEDKREEEKKAKTATTAGKAETAKAITAAKTEQGKATAPNPSKSEPKKL